jgi:hypothetical protein
MGLLELLYSSPWGPWLGLLQTAFMVWMLVDAYRRGADWFWMLLIFFVPFFGAWAYFFLVKVQAGDLHRLGLGRVGAVFHRGPSLAQLRYLAEQTPTLTNHVNLADKLIELKRYAEALCVGALLQGGGPAARGRGAVGAPLEARPALVALPGLEAVD